MPKEKTVRRKTAKRLTRKVKPSTKVTLFSLYNAMNRAQQQDFRDTIQKETGKSVGTIYYWIAGNNIPCLADQKIIETYLAEEKLFTNQTTK